MDPLEMTNDEFDFDDNGLQDAQLPSSWQEIVPVDFISENDTEDSPLSQREVIPLEINEDGPTVVVAPVLGKSYGSGTEPFDDESWKLSVGMIPGKVGQINNAEIRRSIHDDDQVSKTKTDHPDYLDSSICDMHQKKEAENLDFTIAISSTEVEVTAKFRSGRSAKNGGRLNARSYMAALLSLVTFYAKFIAKISWQFSVSATVGILFLMPSVGIGVDGAFTSVPVNALFVVGKTARINCSTDLDLPVYWARTLTGSDVQQWLHYGSDGFDSINADSRFSMDRDEATGRYDVIIANVQQKDAGQYECVDESGLGARASAELVVTDSIDCISRIPSDGVMGDNVFGLERDFIYISCSLTYTGNLSPTLEWSWPGSEVKRDERWVSATASSVSSTLKLSPTKELHNVTIQCTASIEGSSQPLIDSAILWKSETVSVRYAEYASKEVDACPGIQWNLVCNPQCFYHFEGRGHEGRCIYTYYDRRTRKSYQTESYAVRSANYVLLAAMLPVAVVIALLVSVAIVVGICVMMRKSKRQLSGDSAEFGHVSEDNKSRKVLFKAIA